MFVDRVDCLMRESDLESIFVVVFGRGGKKRRRFVDKRVIIQYCALEAAAAIEQLKLLKI